MENEKKAYLYAGLTIFLWSTVASVFKISLRHLTCLQLLFIASITSTITLFFILFFQKKLSLCWNLSKRQWSYSLLLGFLNPFLYYAILFKAYSLLPAQEAQTLNFIWPITLVLLSIPMLKQKLTMLNCAAIIISFIGVFIIATRGDVWGFRFSDPVGVSLALGSALIWSLFWIFKVKDLCDDVVRFLSSFLCGFVLVAITVLLFSEAPMPAAPGIIGGIYIGLFEMSITFLVWSKALKIARKTANVAILVYLVPFFSLLCIRVVVGERILLSTVFGLILIVAGIALQQACRRPKESIGS